jgi:hypothetical protein
MNTYTSGQPPIGKYLMTLESEKKDEKIGSFVFVGIGVIQTVFNSFYPLEVVYMAGGKLTGPVNS